MTDAAIPTKASQRAEFEEAVRKVELSCDERTSELERQLEQLNQIAGAATRRAMQVNARHLKYKERSKGMRQSVGGRWRDKVASMRDTWREAAISDVEAAHGSAMLRLKTLKAQALASKRAALRQADHMKQLSVS